MDRNGFCRFKFPELRKFKRSTQTTNYRFFKRRPICAGFRSPISMQHHRSHNKFKHHTPRVYDPATDFADKKGDEQWSDKIQKVLFDSMREPTRMSWCPRF